MKLVDNELLVNLFWSLVTPEILEDIMWECELSWENYAVCRKNTVPISTTESWIIRALLLEHNIYYVV